MTKIQKTAELAMGLGLAEQIIEKTANGRLHGLMHRLEASILQEFRKVHGLSNKDK